MLDSTSRLLDKGVLAFYKFFLFDQIRGKYLTLQGSLRRFDKVKYEFISLAYLKELTNGYLVNDNSLFGVEIKVYSTEGSCLGECFSISKVSNIFGAYKWEINQVSKLTEKCYSDEFVVGGYKWKISMYPKGLPEYKDSSLFLFLESMDSQSFTTEHKVKVRFVLRLKNQLSQKHIQKEDTIWFGSSRKHWGWRSLIELEDVKDSKKGYIVEDRCIIEAEVTVLRETTQKTLDC